MPAPKRSQDALIEKIRQLPPERRAEVEKLVELLSKRSSDSALSRAATTLSEKSFHQVWDNSDDAEYDRL